MKNRLLLFVIYMTKLFTYVFLIQVLTMSILFSKDGKAQIKSLEQVKVKLSLNEIPLVNAFAEIEKETNFKFVYTNKEVNNLGNVSLIGDEATLYDVLVSIAKQTQLEFKQINQTITVKKTNPKIAVSEPVTIQVVDKVITGKVLDENGLPLPGATVLVEGTTAGTVTNIDGEYTITVPDGAVLLFSYIGYTPTRVESGTQTVINITLKVDSTSLEEVLVIGYGTVKKSDLTGSVGSVGADALMERPAPSLNQALAGRVSGVQVSSNSGRPGGRTNVRIRGFSSINSSNNPLYVVDGVQLPMGNQDQMGQAIDYINPNDVISVEVLKDASSTAIYGSRGANGVILITTKKGKSGEGTVTYNVDFSVATIGPNRPRVLNAKEYMAVEDLAWKNMEKYDPNGWKLGRFANLNPALRRTDPRVFDSQGNPLFDTDWLKETTQNKLSQNHQLGFTGGNERTTYSLSLNYRDDQGLVKTSELARYSTRFTIDDQVKSWLKVGATLSYNSQSENLVDINDAVARQMVEDFPFLPVRYADGTFADNRDYPFAEGTFSSMHRLSGRRYVLNTQTTLGSIYSNIKIADGLEMRTVLGVNVLTQERNQSTTATLAIAQNGTASRDMRKESFWSLENYLTYNKVFADRHAVTGLLGISWQETNINTMGASIQNFATDFFSYNNLGAGSLVPAVRSNAGREALQSYFGRVNYSLDGKYLFTATGRADGSSKFGENYKYSFFPSVALAWRISEEGFLKGNNKISNLKVRGSHGLTGNSEIPAYSSLPLLSADYRAVLNEVQVGGTGILRLANPNLRWEKTTQSDIGVELGLFNNKITFEVDLYYRKTTDMLLDAPVPRSSGFATIRSNVGSMENKGIELTLNTVNVESEVFTWNTSFNLSANRNKVLSLATPADIFGVGGPNFTNPTNIIRVGEQVGSFWGLERLGIWSEAERAQAAEMVSYRGGLTMLPGDVKYNDVNKDGVINDNDRMIIGNGNPDFWGAMSNTFRYKNLDFTIELMYMIGNDILDMTLHPSEDRQGLANSYRSVLNAWTPQNQNTMIAEIRESRAGHVTNVDSHWIKDGSFLRGRNALLGYTFPQHLCDRIKVDRLRAFSTVQNFFLLTGKDVNGDPETAPVSGGNANNVFSNGMNWHSYPRPTTFMLGLQITL
jgi:TonB-linked SusC/RagA family outer membrane protein